MSHPYRDVAIVGVHNTPQARELPGHDSSSIALEGVTGALADAGIPVAEVDGVVGEFAADWILELGLGPCSRRSSRFGIPMLLEAAALVASGECDVVVVGAGVAVVAAVVVEGAGGGVYDDCQVSSPWPPVNFFTAAKAAPPKPSRISSVRTRCFFFGASTSTSPLSAAATALRSL